jgi:hypothetical protein
LTGGEASLSRQPILHVEATNTFELAGIAGSYPAHADSKVVEGEHRNAVLLQAVVDECALGHQQILSAASRCHTTLRAG